MSVATNPFQTKCVRGIRNQDSEIKRSKTTTKIKCIVDIKQVWCTKNEEIDFKVKWYEGMEW